MDDDTIASSRAGVRDNRPAFLETFTTNFFSANGELLVSEAQRRYSAEIAAFASPKGTLDCIGAFAHTDFRPDLEKVDVPTLVVHGDSDAIVPFEISGKRSHHAVAGSSLAIIVGAPHGRNATHPQEFNAAPLEVLQS